MQESETTTFEVALECIKAGYTCYRKGWNGKGLTVQAQYPDEGSKMTNPYLYMVHNKGRDGEKDDHTPWVPSQIDIFTEDWVVIREEKAEPEVAN